MASPEQSLDNVIKKNFPNEDQQKRVKKGTLHSFINHVFQYSMNNRNSKSTRIESKMVQDLHAEH